MSSIDRQVPQDESHPHQELINGLLQLAGWLTDHPELPTDDYDEFQVRLFIPGHEELSDSDRVAALRRIAAVLDVEPSWSNDTHLYATRRFGARVKIQACAITRAYMEEHQLVDVLGREALREQRRVKAELASAIEEGQAELDARGYVGEGQADEAVEPLAEVECADCRGIGYQRDGSSCADCLGKGRVLAAADPRRPEKRIEETAGFPSADEECAICEGSGQSTDEFGICDGRPCEHCHGSGVRPSVGVAW